MDQLLRQASVIDGTGAPARRADVAVTGDRISAVGPSGEVAPPSPEAEVVDLDGLALAPGFIDIHTHYDAQVLWDPDLTPSSWHGVTSVVMGNCGFGVAPTRPEHRDTIVRTLVQGGLQVMQAMVEVGAETNLVTVMLTASALTTSPAILALLEERFVVSARRARINARSVAIWFLRSQ